ncbi:MAG: VWA domain-containing protein [Bdellovibrionota bacterium]
MFIKKCDINQKDKMVYKRTFALLNIFFLPFFMSCKFSSENAHLKRLNENLTLASTEELNEALTPGQCLVEVKRKFENDLTTQEIDIDKDKNWLPLSEATPEFAWRGRLDIEKKIVTGPPPLTLAILIDSSGSLKTTDPDMKRKIGVEKLLVDTGKNFKGFYDRLKIKVISFGYCVVKQETFTGTSTADYNSFLKKIDHRDFYTPENETNYINALKTAHQFLTRYGGEGKTTKALSQNETKKQLVLFSDGMPWIKQSEVSDNCQHTVEKLKTMLNEGNIATWDDFIAHKGSCFEGHELPKSCTEIKPEADGLSGLDLKSSLDPTNFRMAMAHHIYFANKYLANSGINFHTIFLNNKNCWEHENSKDERMRKEFQYLCSEQNILQFFSQLQQTDHTKNTLKTVSNVNDLANTFGKIAVDNSNYEFDEVEYTFPLPTFQSKTDVGQICIQDSSGFSCKLRKKGLNVSAKPVATIPTKIAGEDGQYNFHLDFNKMASAGDLIIHASDVDNGNKNHKFAIKYNLPFSRFEEKDIEKSGFKIIQENDITGKTPSKNILIQLSKNDYRISCKTEVNINYDCKRTDNDEIIPNGGGFETGEICYHKDKCSVAIPMSATCKNGKLIIPEGCPSEDYSDRPCILPTGKPKVCPPNEAIKKLGKVEEPYSVIGYRYPEHENCDSVKGVVTYFCRRDGNWIVLNEKGSVPYKYPKCVNISPVPIPGNKPTITPVPVIPPKPTSKPEYNPVTIPPVIPVPVQKPTPPTSQEPVPIQDNIPGKYTKPEPTPVDPGEPIPSNPGGSIPIDPSRPTHPDQPPPSVVPDDGGDEPWPNQGTNPQVIYPPFIPQPGPTTTQNPGTVIGGPTTIPGAGEPYGQTNPDTGEPYPNSTFTGKQSAPISSSVEGEIISGP